MKAIFHPMKLTSICIVLFLLTESAYAQKTQAADPYFWEKVFGQITVIAACIVIVAALLTVVRLFGMLVKLQEIQMLKDKGIEEVVAQYAQPEKSLFARIWDKMQGTIPLAREKEILFEHEYDGIRELDNSLPPWWLWMFYISIVIAGVYFYIYHISGTGLSSKEQYEVQMATAKIEVDDYLARQADLVSETNVVMLTDEKGLAEGAGIYKAVCAVCHGPSGEGGVGPNMTDQYWIHGGDIKNLYRTIRYGVPEKGMISWSSQLRPADMQKVASYILTLQGTSPANPKPPQGDLWVTDSKAMGQDTIVQ